MKIFFKLLRLTSILLIGISKTMAQDERLPPESPVVGKPCAPIHFEDVKYSSQPVFDLEAHRGKWVILDFFSAGCSACFSSFPKLNALRKEYAGKIDFLLIGKDDRHIRKSYENYRVKESLNLPVAYDTSVISRMGIGSFPIDIWVDDKGIIRAATGPDDLDHANLDAFLKGEPFTFTDVSDTAILKQRAFYKNNKLLLVNGNGGDDTTFLFRSILSHWDKRAEANSARTIRDFADYIHAGCFQCTGEDLSTLYRCAYSGEVIWSYEDSLYGLWWPEPLLEISDSSLFAYDFKTGKNLFSYAVSVPVARTGDMMRIMQNDLENYFGFRAAVETRKMPCWNLVVSDPQKVALLKTKHTGIKSEYYFNSVLITNCPITRLFRITGKLDDPAPWVDLTGIKENIDISFSADMLDINAVRKALHEKGLDLVKGVRDMQVVVIRNPTPSPVGALQ